MRTLFIDLASAERAFALIDGDAVVGTAEVADHRDEAALMPAIGKLIADARWNRTDVERIAAVAGPGGFMTIRVAISLANALAYGWKIPLAGVHGADVWAARVMEKDWMWIHSTKKTHAFVRGFGKHAKAWAEPELVSIDDLSEALPKGTLWAGELLPEQLAVLSGLERVNAKPLRDVLPGLAAGLAYEEKTLLPWYGRGA